MRLIIDTDPGNGYAGADVDDALAIALALKSPEVDLLAITVVAGNVPVDCGVQGALEVLEAADELHIPVHRGADRPLMQDPRPWRALLDTRRDDRAAQRLWDDGVPAARSTLVPDPHPAAQMLVDLVDAHPGEITVLAIGPLTNIATAMLLDPEWQDKVARNLRRAAPLDRGPGEVEFMDSTGLGVLRGPEANPRPRRVASVVCTRENILKIFRITGLTQVFACHPDVAAAASSMDALVDPHRLRFAGTRGRDP